MCHHMVCVVGDTAVRKTGSSPRGPQSGVSEPRHTCLPSGVGGSREAPRMGGPPKGYPLIKCPGEPGESFKRWVTRLEDIPSTVGDRDLFVWVRETLTPSCWCFCPCLSLSFPTCRVGAVNTPSGVAPVEGRDWFLSRMGVPGLPSAGAGAQPVRAEPSGASGDSLKTQRESRAPPHTPRGHREPSQGSSLPWSRCLGHCCHPERSEPSSDGTLLTSLWGPQGSAGCVPGEELGCPSGSPSAVSP